MFKNGGSGRCNHDLTFARLASSSSAKIFGALLTYRLVISGLPQPGWFRTNEIYRMPQKKYNYMNLFNIYGKGGRRRIGGRCFKTQ